MLRGAGADDAVGLMCPPSHADATPAGGERSPTAPEPVEDAIETVEPDAATSAAEAAATADAAELSEVSEQQASAEVMALLSEHVPLALLADLAQPEGPASPTILEDEGLPDDPWWE